MGFLNPYSEKLKEFSDFVFDGAVLKDSDWLSFFENRMARRSQRSILEIGCSNARFLSQIATVHPQVDFIGVDWKFKVLYKGATFVAKEKLRNVALIRGRAQLLMNWFCEGDLDEIWIFFPDPWPKTTQTKNRLIQEGFLLEADRLLKPGGKIYFKTDHPGYFQWVLALLGVEAPVLSDYDKLIQRTSGEKNRRAKQYYYRRVEKTNLPKTSNAVLERFKLTKLSADFWGKDSGGATLFSKSDAPLFIDHKTLFEEVFLKDSLPIYFCEITKG